MAKAYMVFWINNSRIGSCEMKLKPEAIGCFKNRGMSLVLIQRDQSGTEHYEVFKIKKGRKYGRN
jgi:hypothetical protein